MKNMSLKVLIASAVLAAFSATVQLIHLGYQSPQWGMWIDIVAVSWIVAFFLYGMQSAVLVSVLGSVVITLFAPDTWLGASMKLGATLPILVLLFFVMKAKKNTPSGYEKWTSLIVPLLIGSIVRCLIVIPVNYYYAIPIWTKMTPVQAMHAIPWYIIAGFNIVQTIVDVGLAWILVFRFKLNRYAPKEQTNEDRS